MTQVIDRRHQPGPSFMPASATSSPSSPSKAKASSPNPKGVSASAGSNGGAGSRPWSAIDDVAIQRGQAFIAETKKNPVQFVKSNYKAVAEVPYPAINDPKVIEERRRLKEQAALQRKGSVTAAGPRKSDEMATSDLSEPSSSPKAQLKAEVRDKKPDLYPYKIHSMAPTGLVRERGVGLHNKGNTCYMNSVLQSLVHLPPLLNALLTQDDERLRGRFGSNAQRFDALGEMASLAKRLLGKQGSSGYAVSPTAFLTNLKSYARTLRPFRQEDAHEFLRFLLDAMQKSSLIRAPKSLKPADPIRETTLVHKIFGGRLRSRVQCQVCKHNSDTFDPILDLSLDIRNLPSNTLGSALHKFTEVDHLRGSEKYKCEKCRKPVNATKQFTIDQAPRCLTIHLKRFTLTGQKLSKQIQFTENLTLGKEVLSEGVRPAHYTLRSVVHHQGSGPNSGHYIASVRHTAGTSNKWFEANDDIISSLRGAPTGSSSAYILFYVRRPEDTLSEAVGASPSSSATMQRINGTDGKIRKTDGALTPKTKLASSPSSSVDLGQRVERPGTYTPAFRPIAPSAPANASSTPSPSFSKLIDTPVLSASASGNGGAASPQKRPAPSDEGDDSDDDDDDDGADDLGEPIGKHVARKEEDDYEPLTKAPVAAPSSPSLIKSKKQRRRERQRLEEEARALGRGGGSSPYLVGGLQQQQKQLKKKKKKRKIDMMKSRV